MNHWRAIDCDGCRGTGYVDDYVYHELCCGTGKVLVPDLPASRINWPRVGAWAFFFCLGVGVILWGWFKP